MVWAALAAARRRQQRRSAPRAAQSWGGLDREATGIFRVFASERKCRKGDVGAAGTGAGSQLPARTGCALGRPLAPTALTLHTSRTNRKISRCKAAGVAKRAILPARAQRPHSDGRASGADKAADTSKLHPQPPGSHTRHRLRACCPVCWGDSTIPWAARSFSHRAGSVHPPSSSYRLWAADTRWWAEEQVQRPRWVAGRRSAPCYSLSQLQLARTVGAADWPAPSGRWRAEGGHAGRGPQLPLGCIDAYGPPALQARRQSVV